VSQNLFSVSFRMDCSDIGQGAFSDATFDF
jgi:hypothetical protein